MNVGYPTMVFAIFLVVDGFLLIARGRGLVDRVIPHRFGEPAHRYLSAAVYFAFAGYMALAVVFV